MVRKLILSTFFVCVLQQSAISDTLYMGSGETYTNLQAAMTAMTAGDTLIIKDGTYTGSTNELDSTHYPPTSSTVWTTIKAENDGKVFFGDPDTTVAHGMFLFSGSSTNAHWQFEGITWYGGPEIVNTSYVKFLRCGAGSNVVIVGNFTMWQASYTSYILFEDCHSWGSGRYGFASFQSDYNVYRRCVHRLDAIDTTHSKTEPIGGFAAYYSSNIEFQNCIMIDSDTPDYWTYESMVGAFTCPNGTGSNNAFRGCIAVNGDLPAGGTAAGYSSITRENCVHWDMDNSTLYSGTNNFDHMTIGVIKNSGTNIAGINGYDATDTANNSIFYDLDGDLGAVYNVTSDYNYFYANSINFTGGSSAGAHDVINVNPMTNSLLYLPQIESGSDLSGQASDSGDVGATVMKRIGTSGTLWGETGYATTTDEDLWPWPNEDIIKTNFASYDNENVSGTRGFCATGKQLNGTDDITLTSYIWEYLGNEIPSTIYGVTPNITGCTLTGGTLQ